MSSDNPDTTGISKSKLYMLRCLIAMAHADGVFHDDEHEYIENMMDKLELSENQISVLREDMANPQKTEELFFQIEEPKFRGQVVYFARLMAFKDGVVEPSEDDLLKRLHGSSVENLDMEEIRANVKKSVEEEMTEYDIKMEGDQPTKDGENITFFHWFDETNE